MTQGQYNVALTLLREGNSDQIRKLFPELNLVFDLVDAQQALLRELGYRL